MHEKNFLDELCYSSLLDSDDLFYSSLLDSEPQPNLDFTSLETDNWLLNDEPVSFSQFWANTEEMSDDLLQSSPVDGGMNMSEGSIFNGQQLSQSSVSAEAGPSGTALKATYLKGKPLIPNEIISDTSTSVNGSSSENPKGKRKRESVENKPQGAKILRDRAERLIRNFVEASRQLKLLCMQTRSENRDLLSQVNLVVSPMDSELQTIKEAIKDISGEGKGGIVTDDKKRDRLKETEHKLDNAAEKYSKFNSEVQKLETLFKSLGRTNSSAELLKRELNSTFPELFMGETAIVEGLVKAATPDISVILQSIAREIKETVDLKPVQPHSLISMEWEASLKKAKEYGFQEKKDAETSLQNLSINIAFRMKPK